MVHIGIIGFGRIGVEHAGWIGHARGARVAAVADRTPARQEMARATGLDVFSELEGMLRDKRIDAVLVSTPTSMHFEHASRALEAGKHVLVEKPMTLNLQEARILVELAKRRGTVLSVFHNRRWDPDYLAVRQAIVSNVFGKVYNVESRLGQFSSCVGPAAKEYRPGWRNEAAFGGGGLYDWGSHFVDQMWRLLWPRRPVNLFAQLRGNVWTRDCDDFARLCLDFDDGTAGLVEINTTTRHPLPRWQIDGELASVFSPPSDAFDLNVWADLQKISDPAAKPVPLPPGAAGLSETQIWEAFVDAIAERGAPAVPVESVLPTMALLDAARQSARAGTTVRVDSSDWRYD